MYLLEKQNGFAAAGIIIILGALSWLLVLSNPDIRGKITGYFSTSTYEKGIIEMDPATAPPFVQSTTSPTPIPTRTPSDRSFKAAGSLFALWGQENTNKFIKNNPSYSGKSNGDMVAMYASYLESNPGELALLEARIEKYYQELKNSSNKTTVVYQESPQLFNSFHCTSKNIGYTTHTSCY